MLSPAAIHSITREFADSVARSSPPGTEIRQLLTANDPSDKTVDTLDVTFHVELREAAQRELVAKVLQAIESVATRHSLTQSSVESREGMRLQFSRHGVATHFVHFHFGAKPAGADTGRPASPPYGRMAIILDDLGSDPAAAEAIFALHFPITLSILPNHPHSAEIAAAAHHHGYQVMLHLPMQAAGGEKAEAEELHPGMPTVELRQLVGRLIESVPFASGVNNHQGSQATADSTLMGELMPLLREKDLFYIDSRTTAASVAYDSARENGVRAAFRNVPFLDDVAETAAIRKQLDLAMRGALTKGEAVAIGHPHRATLEALRDFLPHAQAQGVRLVFASQLTH